MTNTLTPSTQFIRTGGRRLAFAQSGDPEGAPVIFLAPAPGSRLFDPDPAVTRELGVRLITVDRPGYGESPAWPVGALPSWALLADDIAAGVQGLGIDRFSVVGWSNGGIGALALAARAPMAVSAVVVSGAPAPNDGVPWIPEEYRAFLHSLREDLPGALSTLAGALPVASEEALHGLGAGVEDERLLADVRHQSALRVMVDEALRPGVLGLAADIVATNVASWGFDPRDVRIPCTLVYGEADAVVTPAHGEWYAERIAQSSLRVLPGTGHLAPLTHWRAMLTAAVEANS